MGGKKKRAPRLPASAPQDLRDFVGCLRMDIDLDPARLGWLPRPPGIPDSVALFQFFVLDKRVHYK